MVESRLQRFASEPVRIHPASVSTKSPGQLVELLRSSTKILIFTGAGISTPSGIRDFRGPQGIWKERQPVYYDEFMSSETSRIEYWDYKAETWPTMRDAKPNAVHRSFVRLDEKLLVVITQNVDGLHGRAGLRRDKLIELHGSNGRVECQTCHEESDPDPHFESFKQSGNPLTCHCGGFLKPATISFGQSLHQTDLEAADRAAKNADLVVSLGSSLSVYPASQVALVAAQRGAPYVVINRGPTDHDGLTEVTLRIEGDVFDIFPPAVGQALDRS